PSQQDFIESELHVRLFGLPTQELPVVLQPPFFEVHARALLIAMAIPSGLKPYSSAPFGIPLCTMLASSSSEAVASVPSRLSFMALSASAGSRKKSPL